MLIDGQNAMQFTHTMAERMRANDLMKHNIRTLLRGRRLTQRDLAHWCRRSDSWIAKIMHEDRREFPLSYWDKIADFFGIHVYQLVSPGISALTERRQAERRGQRDRRLRHVALVSRESTGMSAANLMRSVEAMHDEDRRVIETMIAQLLRRRIDAPNTATTPPGLGSGDEPRGSTQLRQKTRKPGK